MPPAVKGLILGLANAVAMALGFGLLIALGYELSKGGLIMCKCAKPMESGEAIFLLCLQGIPYGLGAGTVIGVVAGATRRLSSPIRLFVLYGCAVCVLLVPAMVWPGLLPLALIPTMIHTHILERWTRVPTPASIALMRAL
jgi:hypothetical protein